MKIGKCLLTVMLLILLKPTKNLAQEACSCDLAPKLIPQIARSFNSGKLDSAEFYIKQFGQSNTVICKANLYDGLAQIAISKKRLDTARLLLAEEYELIKAIKCKNKPLIRYNNSLVKYHFEKGNQDSVVVVSLKVVQLAAEANEWYAQARALINIGAVFSELKNFAKANYYWREGLRVAKLQKDTTLICAALAKYSSNFYSLYEQNANNSFLDSLYLTSKEALQIAIRSQDLIEVIQVYSNLSRYYYAKNNYAKSSDYADSIIHMSPKQVHDFDRYLMLAYERKAEVCIKQKQYALGLSFADSSLYFASIFNKQLTINPLNLVYQCSKALSNTSRALEAYEQMTIIKDSIFSLEKNKTIQELEKKYQEVQNQKKIQELLQQKRIYLLCSCAALLIIVVIVFYIRQQRLKHKQIILETEQRLNRARMNPHFFFNTLASLQSFALTENDSKNLAANISKFSHIMRETLESTYKEYVTIEQEIDFLKEYLELQKIRFSNSFDYSVTASKFLEIDELLIPSMIIQPFVENALEHGLKGIDYAGEVNVFFTKVGNEISIEISDNGNGLSVTNKSNTEHISRASQIIRDRIYLLNIKLKTKARFIIDNNITGKGVSVKISLPILIK